jgi:hypothetical protein
MKTITLKDVNYDDATILFETDDKEDFKVTFEFIQDLNRYITKEWTFHKNENRN